MALSAFLPLADSLAVEASPANRDVPIFMAHGSEDPIISISAAKSSRQQLVKLGYQVDWHDYRMPHAVCEEEIADIAGWLGKVLL